MMLNKRNRRISKIVTYALLVIFSLYCIFPFIWMLISALKPKDEIRSAVPSLLIDNPTIDNFRRVLVDNGFLTYIKNSFVVSLAATLISMIIAGRLCAEPLLPQAYREGFELHDDAVADDTGRSSSGTSVYDHAADAYAGDAHFSGAGIHHVRHSALHLYDEQLF